MKSEREILDNRKKLDDSNIFFFSIVKNAGQ